MRTAVYIDGANLEKGVRADSWKLDYKKFYKWLSDKYKTDEIYIFLGYLPMFKRYYKLLDSSGFKIVFKKVIKRKGQYKGNCDTELVLSLVKNFFKKKMDRVVLVSGDGDFRCVIDFLIGRRVEVQIIVPNRSSFSWLLKQVDIRKVFLHQLKEKLSI